MIFFKSKVITYDKIVLCMICKLSNNDIQKIFSEYNALPYESTRLQIKNAVW